MAFFVISRGKGICILRAIPGHFLNHVQATAYYMNNGTISFPGHHTDMHNTTSLNQSQTPRGKSTERQGGAEASTARTRMHLSAASFTCENGNKNSRAFWSASGQKAYLDGHEHAQKQTYLPNIAGSGRNHSSQHLHCHCIPVSPGKVLLLRLPVPRLCGRGKILRGVHRGFVSNRQVDPEKGRFLPASGYDTTIVLPNVDPETKVLSRCCWPLRLCRRWRKRIFPSFFSP
ncbi:hypothetical protein BJ166DRAFT_319980 [Pestalotiopsis sp. NC0098]|nr:hypothetical protein BJ166DRAFT_319980 [Pestalotiopsis sp. NC0098]